MSTTVVASVILASCGFCLAAMDVVFCRVGKALGCDATHGHVDWGCWVSHNRVWSESRFATWILHTVHELNFHVSPCNAIFRNPFLSAQQRPSSKSIWHPALKYGTNSQPGAVYHHAEENMQDRSKHRCKFAPSLPDCVYDYFYAIQICFSVRRVLYFKQSHANAGIQPTISTA